ncbi:MAG: stage V sporulation protein G [Nitrospinae bacterium]|nr:stage V sporulation protein G [Nitrospinota bacterium]
MNITAIKIYPFDLGSSQSSLRAYADVVLDDLVLIKGFRIMAAKSGGLFIGMPSKMGKDGKYYDQVEFKTEEFQSLLRGRILEAYKEFS